MRKKTIRTSVSVGVAVAVAAPHAYIDLIFYLLDLGQWFVGHEQVYREDICVCFEMTISISIRHHAYAIDMHVNTPL